MPNTTAYSFGDVVLVPFAFTDQTASKKRPAVVVSTDAYHQRRPDVIVRGSTDRHETIEQAMRRFERMERRARAQQNLELRTFTREMNRLLGRPR